ncbi:phosphatase PAP2 family protein [Tissierella praeacuta]|uniref:phosphatase PAP2 family protein n=1 Tax=Tissierella praeacuta TaxID=43131 RepID=UPI0033404A65
MNEKTYEKITRPLCSHPYGLQMIKTMDKIITISVYCIYPIFLLILVFNRDVRFWRVLLTPGVSFVLVSAFRNYTNFPRPYEVLDIVPIINKTTKGKSFPSRHVFSIFVIAMTLYYISIPTGIALMVIGIILAIIRVLGGVHFPRDVIVGAMTGILSGIIGFYL